MDLEEIKKALFKLELLEQIKRGLKSQVSDLDDQIIDIQSKQLPKLLGLEDRQKVYARPIANLFLKLIEGEKEVGS